METTTEQNQRGYVPQQPGEIIIKRISRAPMYCTRWEHRALYSNTKNTHIQACTHASMHARACTHTHTRTHTHTHTLTVCHLQTKNWPICSHLHCLKISDTSNCPCAVSTGSQAVQNYPTLAPERILFQLSGAGLKEELCPNQPASTPLHTHTYIYIY